MTDDLCQCPRCGRSHRPFVFGKPPETTSGERLREQIERDTEHYQAAMAMSEKHRRLWIEACQERDQALAALAQTASEPTTSLRSEK